MSHRLTIETKITDREAARAALKQANIQFEERGDTIYLKTGAYRDTEINLKTGLITSGDVDFNRGIDQGQLGLLRQFYTEAKLKAEFQREGVQILERTEEVQNGEKVIIITAQTA
jgi:hypothetical protein